MSDTRAGGCSMITRSRGVSGRSAALALVAAAASMAVQAEPLAHVVAPGERFDHDMAYVVLVPHVTILDQRALEVDGLLVGKATDGRAVAYAVTVSPDRPTIIGVVPGRYFLSRLYEGRGYWPLEENDSQFDAKADQLNYPGDWYIQVEYHDIVRGARTIGHRVAATLTLGGGAVDLAPLGLDPAFSALPLLQTHVEAIGRATGFGER